MPVIGHAWIDSLYCFATLKNIKKAYIKAEMRKKVKRIMTTQKPVETAAPVKIEERYAIIQTGGKQYQAIEGKTLAIEKIDGEVGSKLKFDEVLLRKLGIDNVEVGQPFLKTAVTASIVKQMQGPKVVVFKFKRRKKYRVKKGHRQPITVVRIESI